MTTKRTTVYFTQDVYDWLAEMARRERRSVSSMTEALIDWHRQNMPVSDVDLPTPASAGSVN